MRPNGILVLEHTLCGSRTTQRYQRQLRSAIEPEWHTDGANSSIDVELQAVFQMKKAFDILPAQRWHIHGAEKRQAHLAAVRVAGKHQIDASMTNDAIGEVRLVRQQNHGFPRSL